MSRHVTPYRCLTLLSVPSDRSNNLEKNMPAILVVKRQPQHLRARPPNKRITCGPRLDEYQRNKTLALLWILVDYEGEGISQP